MTKDQKKPKASKRFFCILKQSLPYKAFMISVVIVIFLVIFAFVWFFKQSLEPIKLSLNKQYFYALEPLKVKLNRGDIKNYNFEIIDDYGRAIAYKKTKSNQKQLTLQPKTKNIKPGAYRLIVKKNQQSIDQLEFNWGILAINTDQDQYQPGETVEFSFAALNQSGHTICQAPLELIIQEPDGRKVFLKTQDRSIKFSSSCGADNVTEKPDYYSSYSVYKPGRYQLTLINQANQAKIESDFLVSQDNDFFVLRSSAIRINPFKSTYKMNITVQANKHFSGMIKEKVPLDFQIKPDKTFQINQSDHNQVLVYPVELKPGKLKTFEYYYQAPKISPMVFEAGPVDLVSTSQELIYTEKRSFQIASDSIGDNLAWLTATQTNSITDPNNFNAPSAAQISWSQNSLDINYFSHSTGLNPERVTVNQNGDYYVALTVPLVNTSGDNRTNVQAQISVNGVIVPEAVTQSSYIRNASGHTESSLHLAVLLDNLSSGDYLEVSVQAVAVAGQVEISGQASLYLEYIDSTSRSVFSGSATQTTNSTNLNQTTGFPLEWTHARLDPVFGHSDTVNPEEISLDNGYYFVAINIPVESYTNRTNVKLQVLVNGSLVPGGEAAQSYIRNTDGHNSSSVHWVGIIDVNGNNRPLTINTFAEANVGNVVVPSGQQASIFIEELPNNNIFFATGNTLDTGLDWNTAGISQVEWTNSEIIDNGIFSHSTALNPHQITVTTAGDYLLIYNDSVTSTTDRTANQINVQVNGLPVLGAQSKTHYIRNLNEHNESSASLVFLLKDLQPNDVISITTNQEAAAGAVTTNQNALIALWYKPINRPVLTQQHYHFRNDDGSENTATSATSGAQDQILSNWDKGQNIRLRLEVSNQGTSISSPTAYRLEYGEKGIDCDSVSNWIDVGALGGAWDLYDSINLVDNSDTSNIAIASGGVSDENINFKLGNQAVKDLSSQTNALTLANDEFVEFEYSIISLNNAKYGSDYCFRLSASGSELDDYQNYAQISMKSFKDFKIQRGSIQATNPTTTLTAGVDYVAPSAADKAFVRLTNSQHTGAGHNIGGGGQQADDVTIYLSNTNDLTTGFDLVRSPGASNSTHVDMELIEYIGPVGGPNEFVVRNQGTLTFPATALTANSASIAGIQDDNDVVVFIAAIASADAGNSLYNTMQVTADWDPVNDQVILQRAEAGNNPIAVSGAVVEFTGSNWQTQRQEHTYTSAGVVETQTISTLNNLNRAFLHTQKRVGTGLTGLDEFGHEVWLNQVDQISFQLQAGADSPTSQTSVAWIIENLQATGEQMQVTRTNGTQSGGSEPASVDVNNGKILTDLSVASIFINNRCTGAGTMFPRPIMGAALNSESQYQLWISDTGQTRTYRTEIVEWPTSEPVFTQLYYAWYQNQDSTDVGRPYLAQNQFVVSEFDRPFRLRVLVNVDQKPAKVNNNEFKLQFASTLDGCDSAFSGETYSDVTNSSAIAFYDNPSAAHATALTANPNDPENPGFTTRIQQYVEANPFSNSINSINQNEDGLWDFALSNLSAQSGARYCLRIVKSDGSLLDNYINIPEIIISPSASQQLRHGKFFDQLNQEIEFTY
ncbi:MAG: hypothetical protein GF332_00005 [Candidatus Moranbacteria bacterium]|nr:hypothetical protein [Candidatus Moranbacteria bacterium]